MNKNKFSSILRAGIIMAALLMTFSSLLQSCDDDETSAPPSFSIEGDPSGLTSGRAGKTQSYVVRATGSWQIIAKEEGTWAKAFPTEGEDDGTFKITVSANENFDERLMNFAFVVNGEEQPVLFRVEQEANVPYITLPAKVIIPAPGGNFDVAVTSNVAWNYTISDDAWLTEVSKTGDKLTLNAAVNPSAKRTVTMTVTATDFPSLSQTVTLEQSPGSIVLVEDFSWLAYGSAVPYTTTNEKKIADWTPEQQAKGWTSSLNPLSIAANPNNDRLCYARQGFVKIGITGFGGDIISPKLSTIEGTKNVKVTFKAVAYLSAAGTVIDSRVLVIEALGAGTPSVNVIMVENVPNTQPQDNAGVVNNVWADDRAFSFTITGATANTQIRFLGKAFDLRTETPTTNRIFLDDIKVEIVQ